MNRYARKLESYCALNSPNLYLSPAELADVLEKVEGLEATNDADMGRSRRARIGNVVELLDLYDDSIVSFELVLPEHSDPTSGRLSVLSPIGAAILGRRAGEMVRVGLLGSQHSYLICRVLGRSSSAASPSPS